MTKNKEGFLLYKAFYEPIKHLSNEDKGKLLDALFKYQIEGSEDTESSIYPFFLFFKNQFRLDQEKYKERCKKNAENIRQRWNKENTNEYERIETNTNDTKHTDKEKEKDKDKEKEKENVKENENKPIVQNENHFDEFWKHYTPIETSIGSKAKAKKKYQEYLKKYTHDKILEATQRYINHCKKNNQKTKMCYGFFDEHLESYMNVKKPIDKEEDKKRKLKAINEIVGQKLFSSLRQLQSNEKTETVFLFIKNDADEKTLRSLPESKKDKIRDILSDMLINNKKLEVQIPTFPLD
jgi:hypothetical protein